MLGDARDKSFFLSVTALLSFSMLLNFSKMFILTSASFSLKFLPLTRILSKEFLNELQFSKNFFFSFDTLLRYFNGCSAVILAKKSTAGIT